MYSFDIDSVWDIRAQEHELEFVVRDPMHITNWWSKVFMRAEAVGGDINAECGLDVKLWAKGLLPHTFLFEANAKYDESVNRLMVRTVGDFDGLGTIELVPSSDYVTVCINWRVNVNKHYLYLLMIITKPLFTANHKWAMRQGKRGLQKEIERRRRGETTPMRLGKPTFPHNIIRKPLGLLGRR